MKRVLGGVAVGVPAFMYFMSSTQKDVAKTDHVGQKELRSDKPGIHDMSTKDISSSTHPSDHDMPNDAPNNPANKEKVSDAESVTLFLERDPNADL